MGQPGGAARPSIALVAPLAFGGSTGIARYQTELVGQLAPRLPLKLLVPKRAPGALADAGVDVIQYRAAGGLARNLPRAVGGLARRRDLIDWHPATQLSLIGSRFLAGVAADAAKADLVHGTQNWVPETRGKAVRVVTVLDTIPLQFPREVTRTTRRSFLRPKELRPADRVIAISKATLEDLERVASIHPEHARVVYLGIDHERFRPGRGEAAPPAPYMLSVGMVEPRKNFARGLRAFERLQKGHRDLRWKVVGSGDFGRRPFTRALRASPCLSSIDWLPRVSDERLALLYQGARFVFVPSLAEGFGLPVAEALACGAPVAASHLAAIREAGGAAFVPFDPMDVESIVEACEKAGWDTAGAAARREGGLQHVRQFTWQRCARGTAEVYADALGCPVADLMNEA